MPGVDAPHTEFASPEASASAPRFALAQNTPNPFGGPSETTAIEFELGNAAHATLRIYDVSGRLVWRLLDMPLSPGRHQARWNGRDDRGADVGAGVFLYRLEVGSFVETRRLVRIR